MTAAAAFCSAALASWIVILVIGRPAAFLATPWIVLLGGFVLPGLTPARLPLSGAWLLGLLLFASRERLGATVRRGDPAAVAFTGFLALLFVITLRSPDAGQGVRMVVQGSVALATAVAFRLALDDVPRDRLLASAALAAATLALAVTWFRLAPGAEMAFWRSAIGRTLIEPVSLDDMLRGYWFQANNSLDPAKAGAVFINANVASVYLSLHLVVAAITLGQRPATRWAQLALPALIVGTLATGSRMGAVAVLLAVTAALLAARVQRRVLVALAAAVIVLAIPIAIPTLARLTPRALLADERVLLWPLAARHVLDAPVFGGGFGDWENWVASRLQVFGLRRALPPHNLVLHLALWGGAVAVGVFGLFVYTLARGMWRGWRDARSTAGDALAVGLLIAVVLLHAMFDNFFLFDWHIGPAAATLVALLWPAAAAPADSPTPPAPGGSAP